MNPKLSRIKANQAKKKALESKERFEANKKTVEDLSASIERLYKLINSKSEFDPTELTKQIATIAESIDIKHELLLIHEAINKNKPKDIVIPPNKPVDFTKIIKAIERNKPSVTVDFFKLEKAIIQLEQKIEDSTVEEGQAPQDYKPVRRVVLVGKRLVFDDKPTTAGRSGGGGREVKIIGESDEVAKVTDGKLEVAATFTGGDASAANQLTEINRLDSINDALALGTISTRTSVAGSASAETLKASNTNRIKLVIFNDSIADLYVAEGSGATTSDFTYKLLGGETVIIDDYSGIVTGIWSAATGNARITETT